MAEILKYILVTTVAITTSSLVVLLAFRALLVEVEPAVCKIY